MAHDQRHRDERREGQQRDDERSEIRPWVRQRCRGDQHGRVWITRGFGGVTTECDEAHVVSGGWPHGPGWPRPGASADGDVFRRKHACWPTREACTGLSPE